MDLHAGGLEGVFRAPAPNLTPYQRIPPSLKARRDEFRLLAGLSANGAVEAVVASGHGPLHAPPVAGGPRAADGRARNGSGDLAPAARVAADRSRLPARRPRHRDGRPRRARRPLRRLPAGPRAAASVRARRRPARFDPRLRSGHAALERAPRLGADPSFRSGPRVAGGARAPRRAARAPPLRGRSGRLRAGGLPDAGLLARPRRRARSRPSSNRRRSRKRSRPSPSGWPATAIRSATSSPPRSCSTRPTRIAAALDGAAIVFDRLGLSDGEPVKLPAEAIAGHAGRTAEAAAEIARWLETGGEALVAARPTGGAEKARHFAREYGIACLLGAGAGRARRRGGRDLGGLSPAGAAARALRRERDLRRGEAGRHAPRAAVGGVPLGPAGPEARATRWFTATTASGSSGA